MKATECIKTRRSIRRFTDSAVTDETMKEIVGLASYSPSWKNTQVVRYMAVRDDSVKNRIADECVLGFEGNNKIIRSCPVLTVISVKHGISGYERSGEPSTSKEDRWEVFDAGIATQTFCLAAHELGLGTVIMGIFDEKKVAEAVSLPEGQKAAALVATGYPALQPDMPKRKTAEDILIFR